jgi:hypothetical protein
MLRRRPHVVNQAGRHRAGIVNVVTVSEQLLYEVDRPGQLHRADAIVDSRM